MPFPGINYWRKKIAELLDPKDYGLHFWDEVDDILQAASEEKR